MILDSSAVLTILFREPGFEAFEQVLADAPICRISAAGFVEVSIVLESRGGDAVIRQCDALFREARILIEPVTQEQALLARQGYSDYGKGRHPAGLNFGDCFSYALAKALGEPLLFKGDDFRQTDLQPALPRLGRLEA
jgi:ribonuclease VapC